MFFSLLFRARRPQSSLVSRFGQLLSGADVRVDGGDMFGSVEDGVDAGVYAQDDGRGDMADAGGAGD